MMLTKENDRAELFLSDPEFFKERLQRKSKRRNLDLRAVTIAAEYIETRDTLKVVGERNGITGGRVRQIVAHVLRRVENIARKVNMQEKLGYKLFQEDPDGYYYKIKEKYSPRNSDIALAYLLDKKKPIDIAAIHKVSEATVYGVVGSAIKFIEDSNEPDKVSKVHPIYNKRGQAITQKEFDDIKELLFRGEVVTDIVKIYGRSWNVVNLVKKAKDYKDYFKISREIWEKYSEKNSVETNKAEKLPEPFEQDPLVVTELSSKENKYLDKLVIAKQQLDCIMTEFIAEEVRLRLEKNTFKGEVIDKLRNI